MLEVPPRLLDLFAWALELLLTVLFFVLCAIEVVLLDAVGRDLVDFTLFFELGLLLTTFLLLDNGLPLFTETGFTLLALRLLFNEIPLELEVGLPLSAFTLPARDLPLTVLLRPPDLEILVFLLSGV